jgi:hypothetical protein
MRSHSFLALVTFFVFVALPWTSVTAQPQPQADITVDNAGRTAVIDALLKELNEAYVFPEVAKKMEADIRGRASSGEYDEFTSGMKFAEKLTADLQGVSNDKHLRVRHSARPIPERTERTEPTAEERQQFERQMRLNNYGFRKVETLLGNIGYVEFRGFVDPKLGAETVRSAMAFVRNSDAIIFDLRENGGATRIWSRLFRHTSSATNLCTLTTYIGGKAMKHVSFGPTQSTRSSRCPIPRSMS